MHSTLLLFPSFLFFETTRHQLLRPPTASSCFLAPFPYIQSMSISHQRYLQSIPWMWSLITSSPLPPWSWLPSPLIWMTATTSFLLSLHPCSFGRPQREAFFASYRFWWFQMFLGLEFPNSSLYLCLHVGFSSAPSLPIIGDLLLLVIKFRVHLDNLQWSHLKVLNYICKDPFPK